MAHRTHVSMYVSIHHYFFRYTGRTKPVMKYNEQCSHSLSCLNWSSLWNMHGGQCHLLLPPTCMRCRNFMKCENCVPILISSLRNQEYSVSIACLSALCNMSATPGCLRTHATDPNLVSCIKRHLMRYSQDRAPGFYSAQLLLNLTCAATGSLAPLITAGLRVLEHASGLHVENREGCIEALLDLLQPPGPLQEPDPQVYPRQLPSYADISCLP